jgi:hypothetical protein
LRKGYTYVTERCGVETAERLFVSNPRAAVDGAEWPVQPEAMGLLEHVPLTFDPRTVTRKKAPENGVIAKDTRKRGFWSRLLSR